MEGETYLYKNILYVYSFYKRIIINPKTQMTNLKMNSILITKDKEFTDPLCSVGINIPIVAITDIFYLNIGII